VQKWCWLGRRVERQWRTLFDHMEELHQKQKLVSLWQCMEEDGPTLQLCFFVYYCKRNGCVGAEAKRREEKGGKDCLADMMRGLKR